MENTQQTAYKNNEVKVFFSQSLRGFLFKKSPDECVVMSDVRLEIDVIDEKLVQLLARRTEYIESAARIKPKKSQVKLTWRINEVIANVLKHGDKYNLSADISKSVFKVLVKKSIAHEFKRYKQLHKKNI